MLCASASVVSQARRDHIRRGTVFGARRVLQGIEVDVVPLALLGCALFVV